MSSHILRPAVLLIALPLLVAIWPRSVAAATLTVTDLVDTGAPGQLRTLITFAASGDRIVIPASTITLSQGALLIPVKILTIQGTGPGATIIDGVGIDRVFDIIGSSVFGSADVTVSGVIIRNGKPAAPSAMAGASSGS